jgi:hypothetical protein
MNFMQSIIPRVPKRTLLFVAAAVWTFAGGMLLFRGILFAFDHPSYLLLRLLLSVVGGGLFYWGMFSKISLKHTQRILAMENVRPCLFSFFNVKSYILMSIMITGGILLRTSGIMPPAYLFMLYITMGIPLSLSAVRFYYYGVNYHRVIKRNTNT